MTCQNFLAPGWGVKEGIMVGMKSVLVVDDDEDVLAFVTSVLSKHYRVVPAFSGRECMEALGRERPDAILLDVIMTHLSDGFDCLRRIKEDPATKAIPVIMMTSVSEVYDYRSQIEESFFPHDRWLDKPVKPEVLLETLREVLAGQS
jgi:CheY-like chemotaxis protein